MLRVNCSGSPRDASAAATKFSLQSGPDGNCQLAKDYILNMSPRPSNYHLNSAAYLGRILPDQSSIHWESEKASCCNFISPIPSSKSSADLLKEISTLEIEIMHLEHHLLSLYRTAFEQHLPAILEDHATHLQHKTGSPAKSAPDQLCHKTEPRVWKGGLGNKGLFSPPCVLTDSDDRLHAVTLKSSSRKEKKSADQVHHSLAEHLGTSRFDIASGSPDKLSEDIVRCIAAIYCKLASPTAANTGFSVSSSSSLSSSSTFSPRDLSDSWSPNFPEEAGGNPQFQGLKEDNRPYASAVEVLNICLDDDSFNYAAKMLQSFRSLVKSLEKVDPRKMKREEKLAFWINIHNALVMHAYLAYGTHNHVRSTSILKAAYNVGGECINAYVIQDSILGIRSHYSAPWLQTLLTPGKKFKTGNTKHIYAIEYPEPLVHFALCSGAHSDPAVRVYMAANIFRDLRLAKEDFIRGTIHIHKGAKIHLPKILCYYAKDMSFTIPGLLEVLNGCLTDNQQKAVGGCTKGRPDKYIYWVPQSSTFRYVIHREVAREVMSI